MAATDSELRAELIRQRIIRREGSGDWIPTPLRGRVHVGLELDDAGRAIAQRHIAAGEFGRREMLAPWTRGGQR